MRRTRWQDLQAGERGAPRPSQMQADVRTMLSRRRSAGAGRTGDRAENKMKKEKERTRGLAPGGDEPVE